MASFASEPSGSEGPIATRSHSAAGGSEEMDEGEGGGEGKDGEGEGPREGGPLWRLTVSVRADLPFLPEGIALSLNPMAVTVPLPRCRSVTQRSVLSLLPHTSLVPSRHDATLCHLQVVRASGLPADYTGTSLKAPYVELAEQCAPVFVKWRALGQECVTDGRPHAESVEWGSRRIFLAGEQPLPELCRRLREALPAPVLYPTMPHILTTPRCPPRRGSQSRCTTATQSQRLRLTRGAKPGSRRMGRRVAAGEERAAKRSVAVPLTALARRKAVRGAQRLATTRLKREESASENRRRRAIHRRTILPLASPASGSVIW